MRRKSCLCLGSLGLILTKEEIEKVVSSLLNEFKKLPNYEKEERKYRENKLFIASALSSLSRMVP